MLSCYDRFSTLPRSFVLGIRTRCLHRQLCVAVRLKSHESHSSCRGARCFRGERRNRKERQIGCDGFVTRRSQHSTGHCQNWRLGRSTAGGFDAGLDICSTCCGCHSAERPLWKGFFLISLSTCRNRRGSGIRITDQIVRNIVIFIWTKIVRNPKPKLALNRLSSSTQTVIVSTEADNGKRECWLNFVSRSIPSGWCIAQFFHRSAEFSSSGENEN